MPFEPQTLMREALDAHHHGDFGVAEARYRSVLQQIPAHADATHFLGLLAHQTGHNDTALELMRRAIELGPQSYLYRRNLAGVLLELGHHDEAERHYQEALTLKPDYVAALIGLAHVHAAQKRWQEALVAYDRALALEPSNLDVLLGRGGVLLELVRRHEALASYRQARAVAARDAEQLQRVGLALHACDAHQDARACFEAALALRPDFIEAHNSLGITFGDLGDLTRAQAEYREVLRIKPDHVGAYHNLTGLMRLPPKDALWPPLMRMLESLADRPLNEQILLHFVAGKVWEDNREFDRAFEHFVAGNRLKRATTDYDATRQARFFRDLIGLFDTGFIAARTAADPGSELPVFIVGMSRSGTTLVEQILASHPRVHGAGEMHLLRRCIYLETPPLMNEAELPQRLAQLERDAFARIGGNYIRGLRDLTPDALRVTDKLPGNMALVGLMHLALPRARIIHCVREPLDTCVSCFTKHFTTGHDFSYDLRELGRFYRLYQELMRHWQEVLPPGCMLEVRYEDVVNNLEGQARRVVEFCGLEWDDACLRFHEHNRTVRTASLAQVRRPIYASSVGRWKNYEKFLDPLKQALAGN